MKTAGAGILRKGGVLAALLCAALACTRSASPLDTAGSQPIQPRPYAAAPATQTVAATAVPTAELPTADPALGPTAFPTPTLDPIRPYSSPTQGPGSYTVQSGDTIGSIANRFGVSMDALISLNQLPNPNALEINQVLAIPLPASEEPGPNFKIVPDSELVFSPTAHGFSTADFLQGRNGYLSSYREMVDGKNRTGAEIVDYVAWHYSVNPRLLLAVLEYRSQWISNPAPDDEKAVWPILHIDGKPYLYKELAWTADQLNSGYYQWKAGGGDYWFLADGSQIRSGLGINAGTAGVQNLMAKIYTLGDWEQAVSVDGLYATYNALFGNPFSWSLDPLIPQGLAQPALILPFEPGVQWYFTGGPHGGWGSGSAFAAIDFGPGDVDSGCVQSEDWVTAAAAGTVVRSEEGMVLVDLDKDGNEQTGWVLYYGHIETRDRIAAGTEVVTGQRLGHPSCEGGVVTGTHVHIARRFNGEWIPADGPIPMVLDGWTAVAADLEYDGYLVRNGVSLEAKGWSAEDNIIRR